MRRTWKTNEEIGKIESEGRRHIDLSEKGKDRGDRIYEESKRVRSRWVRWKYRYRLSTEETW